MTDERTGQPPDFELRKYELDRAHELELNKFAHKLEVESIKILQLINGGAFTVLVGFSAALLQGGGMVRALGVGAAACWIGGLGAAAWAQQQLRAVQSCQNRSNRFRRNAVEWRRLNGQGLAIADLRLRVGPPAKNQGPPVSDEDYDKWAQAAYEEAGEHGDRVQGWIWSSILLFVLGGVLLAASVAFAPPPPPEAAHASAGAAKAAH